MRPVVFALALALLFPSASLAGAAEEVLALEDAFTTALVKRDRAAIEKLLDPGFVYSENDVTVDRESLLEQLLEGADRFTAASNEDMKAHAFGDTVVVTGFMITKGTGPAGSFERRYRFTDTWARRKGRWVLVAAHDYLAPTAR